MDGRWSIDCSDALDWLRGRPAASVDSVITDPPYCSGAATEAGRGSATHQGLRSEAIRTGRFEWFDADNMTTSGLVWLLRSVAVECDRVLKPTGSLVVFCDWRMAFTLGPAMESAGFRMRNLIFWNKGSFGCGSGFRPQHELALHLTRRAPGFHAADVGNVIGLDAKRVPSAARSHPAEKPVELIEKIITVVAPPAAGLVVDPFGGSFAVGEAALKVDRQFAGCDKDPAFCEAGRSRLAVLTHKQAGGDLFGSADLFAAVE